MADYTNLGLNQFLQPANAPVSADRGFRSSTELEATIEALGAAKISRGVFTQDIEIRGKGRILVYNGTVPQVLVGFDEGGF